MNTKKLITRLIAVMIIFLTASSNVFGVLHITGSLKYDGVLNYKIKHRSWIKIKQDLIKRKGVPWLLLHPARVNGFILNNDSECGVFLWTQWRTDSEVLMEIKNSLDELSKSNDSIIVEYIYPEIETAFGSPIWHFDSKRYKSEFYYRDSIDTSISKSRINYAKRGLDHSRFGNYWFLSDSTLYHAPRCTYLFCEIMTDNLIGIPEVIEEYKAECRAKGYDPIFYSESEGYPDWIKDEDTDSRPEMQLLRKYIAKNDSIILNSPLPKDLYDINFKYDHKKLENAPAMVIGKRTLKEVYQELNKPDLSAFTSLANSSSMWNTLLVLTSPILEGILINCHIINYLTKTYSTTEENFISQFTSAFFNSEKTTG